MKKKILSLLTAFAMVFGIIAAPFTSASADEGDANAAHKTKVNIHKVLMDDTAYNEWPEKGKEHDGSKIESITDYFGEQAKLIAGVQFDIYREATDQDSTGKVKGSDIASSVFEAGKEYVLVQSVTTEGETNPKATAFIPVSF